jgi:hypothetical protein
MASSYALCAGDLPRKNVDVMAEAVEEAAEVIKKEKKKVTNILTCIL